MPANSIAESITAHALAVTGHLLQQAGDDIATRVDLFDEIWVVFLGLGTLVAVVVIGYLLFQAYKYRDGNGVDEDVDRPTVGELPRGAEKGEKKLFVSFALSALIVLTLIGWSYGLLMYVETSAAEPQEDALEVEVHGYEFGWDFVYTDDERIPRDEFENLKEEHGEQAVLEALREDDLESLDEDVETDLETTGQMPIPVDRQIVIHTTAGEGNVWHNFGIPELRVKADAMPGETTTQWFVAEEEGEYLAECFELCGTGHSAMTADVEAMSQEEFDEEWYPTKQQLIDELEEEVDDS